MEGFIISRKGSKKPANEDSYNFTKSKDGGVDFFVLADGMGGYQSGDLAGRLATEEIAALAKAYTYESIPQLEKFCDMAIMQADRRVRLAAAEAAGAEKMGTTVVIAAIVNKENCCVFANAGDSRGYVFSGGLLSQVTHDHSIEQLMRDKGYTDEEISKYLKVNAVTRALGYLDEDTRGECRNTCLSEGDIIILCTDGLSRGLENDEIASVLAENYNEAPENLCRSLADMAAKAGSLDDITVFVGYNR